MRPIITLLTDFGTADGYVGEMKGVLLSLVANVELVDITHDIPAQDVHAARLTLARVWRRFPSGTVHLVVVDPGVGSARLRSRVTVAHSSVPTTACCRRRCWSPMLESSSCPLRPMRQRRFTDAMSSLQRRPRSRIESRSTRSVLRRTLRSFSALRSQFATLTDRSWAR
jgi:hypothetical protein